MIIELIGPGAVGKSTIGPILASSLGLPHYAGQGYYNINGEPLSRSQIWADRVISIFADPGLTLASIRAPVDLLQDRVSFTLTTTRRERFARRVRARGMGVLSSGSVHWLCQESTRFEADLSGLLPKIAVSDVYVRLSADADEITRRLEERGGKTPSRVAEHHAWIGRYQGYADKILGRINRPVMEVAADEEPEAVVQRIVAHLEQIPTRGE
jgi:hypothetical protein